jgi:hypothetical protein
VYAVEYCQNNGRIFGRRTQKRLTKNVSGRKNLWQSFGQIFKRGSKKGPIKKKFLHFPSKSQAGDIKILGLFTEMCRKIFSSYNQMP